MTSNEEDGSMQGPPPEKQYKVEFDAPEGYNTGGEGETRSVRCKILHKGGGKCCLVEMDGNSLDEDRVATVNKLNSEEDYEIPKTLREAGAMQRRKKGWMS